MRWKNTLSSLDSPKFADVLGGFFQGFARVRAMFDEVPEFSFWSLRPKQFTPMEFNKLWDSYTADQKINYVLSLIT